MLLCLVTTILLPQLWADPGGIKYEVQPGDTLASIAQAHGMTVRELKRQLEKPPTPGTVLVLNPSGRSTPDPLSRFIVERQVQPGETLQKIAQSLRTKDKRRVPMLVEELADFNGIERLEHEAQPGETVTAVARRYQLTPTQLRAWNDLPSGEELPPGRLLTVGWEEPQVGEWLEYPDTYALAAEVRKTAQALETINQNIRHEVYEVERGDTLESIAARFGVPAAELRDLNGLQEGEKLEEGEPLLIPQPKDKRRPTTSAIPWMPARGALEARVGEAPSGAPVRLPGVPGTRPLRSRMRLVITGERGNQFAVLMPQSGTGWVEKRYVNVQGPAFPSVAPQGRARDALNIAQSYLGTPYVFGGESRRGIDCSAFVRNVFYAVTGKSLPRTAREQVRLPAPVPKDITQMKPGDRLYFDAPRLGMGPPPAEHVDHTGIYMGEGKFIHATPPRVRINLLAGRYWNLLVEVRRDPQLTSQSPSVTVSIAAPC